MNEGELLWQPDSRRIEQANITAYTDWLKQEYGLVFEDYDSLWSWSVENLDDFWGGIWKYFNIQASSPYEMVLGSREMPGADWFPGARLNYAEHILRNEKAGDTALVSSGELRQLQSLGWDELGNAVRIVATQLRNHGIGPGDMVSSYMPNIPESVIAMLATTSIGAIWSSCSPDFGTRNVVERFTQLRPKVLFCVDGYRYRGKDFDKRSELQKIIDKLQSLKLIVYLTYLFPEEENLPRGNAVVWSDFIDHPPITKAEFKFEQVPFKNPLWVLFSSGTTGMPKGIVHSHGGILLEQMKLITFHMDMKANERMFFFTTTGWMMWNFLISSMLLKVVPVLYDGNPVYPEQDQLWKLADEVGVSFFGTSPTYIQMQANQGVVPKEKYQLTKLRSIILAGSPATPENMEWFHLNVKKGLWVATGSGGTDICSGICGGLPTIPSYAGEIQSRHLGVDAHAYNEDGQAVIDEVGELVICKPMPSMPVFFWNDPDNKRYKESYFEDIPGVWRQGDFFKINQRGGCYVLGRSDATLNRYGVRIGTAEIYRCVSSIEQVEDSLIVNLNLPGGRFFMPLFVKLLDGVTLDEDLRQEICNRLKTEYSPRHVPDKIYQVDKLPYTLTGKKMEVPVRKLLMGIPLEKAVNVSVMSNPASLDYFIKFAGEKQDFPTD